MKQNALYFLVLAGCVTILYGLREMRRDFIKDKYNIDIREIKRARNPIMFVSFLIILFILSRLGVIKY
jgi:hypothetical protein